MPNKPPSRRAGARAASKPGKARAARADAATTRHLKNALDRQQKRAPQA